MHIKIVYYVIQEILWRIRVVRCFQQKIRTMIYMTTMCIFVRFYLLKMYTFWFSSTADSFTRQSGMMFSTKDQDNDIKPAGSCAQDSHGAWWYNNCHYSNLNGLYGSVENGKGVNWHTWRGLKHSMTFTTIMVKKSKYKPIDIALY